MPNSLIGSTMTLAVAIGVSAASLTASAAFTQIVTSTLGTFNSTLTNEGCVCSVTPPSPSYINPGDVIQWTTSGGNTSAVVLHEAVLDGREVKRDRGDEHDGRRLHRARLSSESAAQAATAR